MSVADSTSTSASTARRLESPGTRLRVLWARLSPLPGGRWLFNRILARMVPYSGALGAKVVQLDPGHVRVRLRERRSVRNHLRSVHAIALANLGELTTGLAMLGALPDSVRGILVGLEVEYLKKARGLLEAEARCQVPEVRESTELVVYAEIRDEPQDVVAIVRARWRLSPVRGVGPDAAAGAEHRAGSREKADSGAKHGAGSGDNADSGADPTAGPDHDPSVGS